MVSQRQILKKHASLLLCVFLLGQEFLVLRSSAVAINALGSDGSSALEALHISSFSNVNGQYEFLNPKSDQSSLNNNNKEDSSHAADDTQIQDLLKLIVEQEKLMDSAKSKRSLVKRFVKFLRSAYPLEMPLWSEAVQNRVRRATGPRKKRFHIKSRHRKQQNEKEKPEPKIHISKCGCKTVTECLETDEPDKFRLFFSSPPLCRPSPTANPADDLQPTDMCGHSCMCHNTEPPTTDNDKEIYVGHTKSNDYGLI